MEIERKKEHLAPSPDQPVTVTETGNITQIRSMTNEVGGIIRKLDKETYVDTRTGEVKEFQYHAETRMENIGNVRHSLRNLRDIINTNATEPKKCRWVTLTYKENMKDPKRLYEDFKKFNMRFRYYLNNNGLPDYEYVSAAEPQGRGAWHLHIVMIFQTKAPYIENKTLSAIWGHGFVNIQSLKNVDNIGIYLTAYLSDMELTPDAIGVADFQRDTLKAVKVRGKTKAIIKGARMRLYPVGFRIYRCSRGIQYPTRYETTEECAMRTVEGQALTYETTLELSDDTGKLVNTIYYRHYNRKPNKKRVAENE